MMRLPRSTSTPREKLSEFPVLAAQSSFVLGKLLLLSALGATVLFSSAGCVERLLQVRSDPPGAAVHVNGDEVGKTPCDHPFTFYGTVDVTLRAPGHLSHRELTVLSPPWYEVFPVDFFSEIVLPFKFRDIHTVNVTLVESPAEIDQTQRKQLEQKAQDLRSRLPEQKTTEK